MKRSIFTTLFIIFFGLLRPYTSDAHDIIFCGERIPVSNNFVGTRLMNVIRGQVPNVNLPQLRKRVVTNFPRVEYYLRQSGLPEDFKYLAIVESGFLNVTSPVGARGFWQLMPETARDMGLMINEHVDERDNLDKATLAACKVLANYYIYIQKKYKISSWVLTAAAYNFGIGNIVKSIDKQGKDYFSMNLNAETAVYVYKIIAVKELFEFPELYMKNFGYNVFAADPVKPALPKVSDDDADPTEFSSMEVEVNEAETKKIEKKEAQPVSKYRMLEAKIKGDYKKFEDGTFISIELQDNLQVKGRFNRKGTIIRGTGWIIDNKVFIDLGFEGHDVILYDSDASYDAKGYSEQGVQVASLRNKHSILLKVQENNEL